MNARTLVLGLMVCNAPAIGHAQGGGRAGEGGARPGEVLIDRIVAVVGSKSFSLTELIAEYQDQVERRQMEGAPPLPSDSAGLRQVLNDMIDFELMQQKAQTLKLVVTDDDLAPAVDSRMARVRADYKSDAEFLAALRSDPRGFKTAADLRKVFFEQERKRQMQKKAYDTLAALGKMPRVPVPEKDIAAAYDSLVKRFKASNPGPTVTFRQIVVDPQPSNAADSSAKKLADSLLAVLKAGAIFDTLARKFSMDSGSAALGGDVGWFRRDSMVAEFSAPAFATPVGEFTPVVKSRYGYHVIRVDRVRPGEVRARHILISPQRDSSDVARTRAFADTLGTLLRDGASYDSLAAKYHDPAESRLIPFYPFDSLPNIYKTAMTGLKAKDVSKSFDIPTRDLPKVALVQLMARNETGIPTLGERREEIRARLQNAASLRHLLDGLRRETYVSIRLDQPPPRSTQ